MRVLNIVKEHPRFQYPGPRRRILGAESAEEFRDDIFIPWLEENIDDDKLIVDISDFAAYPGSFFEETFRGAAHKNDGCYEAVKRITIKCDSDEFGTRIQKIINDIPPKS